MASLTVKGFIEEFFKGKVVDENERILLEQTLAGKVKGFTKEEESNFIADLNETVNAAPETFYSNGEIKLDKFNSETEKIRMVVSEAREVENGVNATIPTQEVQENPITMEESQKIEEMKFRGTVGKFLDDMLPKWPEEIREKKKEELIDDTFKAKRALERQKELMDQGFSKDTSLEIATKEQGFDISKKSERFRFEDAVNTMANVEIAEEVAKGGVLEEVTRRVLDKYPILKDFFEMIPQDNSTYWARRSKRRQDALEDEISSDKNKIVDLMLTGDAKVDFNSLMKSYFKEQAKLEEEKEYGIVLDPDELIKRNETRRVLKLQIADEYLTSGKSVYEIYTDLMKNENPYNIRFNEILDTINEKCEKVNKNRRVAIPNRYIILEKELFDLYIKLDALEIERENALKSGDIKKVEKIYDNLTSCKARIGEIKNNIRIDKTIYCESVLNISNPVIEESKTGRINMFQEFMDEAKGKTETEEKFKKMIADDDLEFIKYTSTEINISNIRMFAIDHVKKKENYYKIYGNVNKDRKKETLERIAASYLSGEEPRKSIYEYWKELEGNQKEVNISFNDILEHIKSGVAGKVSRDDWDNLEKKETEIYFDSLERDMLEDICRESAYKDKAEGTNDMNNDLRYAAFGITSTREKYKERLFELRNSVKSDCIALSGMKKTMIMGLDSAEKSNIGMQQESHTSQPKTNPIGLQVEELVTNAPTKQRGRFKIFDFINKALKRGKGDIEENMLSIDDCNAAIQEFGVLNEIAPENPLKKGVQGNQMDDTTAR